MRCAEDVTRAPEVLRVLLFAEVLMGITAWDSSRRQDRLE